ncbi:MAG: hypothetical protein ABIG61_11495 [Planctomycetota bacterium]
MKNTILSLLAILILLCTGGPVLAKGNPANKSSNARAAQHAKAAGKNPRIKSDSKDEKKRAEKTTAKAKGKKHQQQLDAVKNKIAREQAKHLKRKTRLERIRELALAQEDTKTVERVDKLIEKEQNRYDRKQSQMQKKQQDILELSQKEQGKESSETADQNSDD